MSNELAVVEQEYRELTPMDLISQARIEGATVATLAQLFELKLRVDADEARKSYSRDFSAFKAEAIRIVKGTDVKAGPLAGTRYANLFDVVKAVTPALSKFNLSHSWKLTKDEKDWMEVTCTISHSLGHSESVSMGAAPDSGPGRNAIQARGSAKTYLERYTLLAATGLTASDADDDGNGGDGEHESTIREYIDEINAAASKDDLKRIWERADSFALGIKDLKLRKRFVDLKDSRKSAL